MAETKTRSMWLTSIHAFGSGMLTVGLWQEFRSWQICLGLVLLLLWSELRFNA